MILAIVLVKANRDPRILLILVPLLIVNLFWTIFKKSAGFDSRSTEMFGMVFHSLVVGVTVLWLLAHKIGGRDRFVFLRSLIIMVVIGLIGTISYGGLQFSLQTTASVILLAILILTMLLGFVLTGWRCRKSYRPVPFMLWLALWTTVVSVVIIFGYAVVAVAIMSISGQDIPSYWILLQAFLIGLVLSGCLYAIEFPYMILALSSPFFRERFYAWLHLKPMSIATRSGRDANQLGGQSPGPDTAENGDSVTNN